MYVSGDFTLVWRDVLMARRTRTVVSGLFIAVAGCLTLMTVVQAQPGTLPTAVHGRVRCNEAILSGAYAVRGDGYLQAPLSDELLPFAVVSLMKLDGAGSLSNRVSASFNGRIQQNTVVGNYSVNGDCSGTIRVTLPGPPFQLNFDLVVADARGFDAGEEFYFISTDAGTAITHTAKRIR
jgi:hypothetical protein